MDQPFAIGSQAWLEALRDGGFSNLKPAPCEPPKKLALVRPKVRRPIPPPEHSPALKSFNGKRCHWCDRKMMPFTATRPTRDHAVPRSRGGTLCNDNCMIICWECNGDKSDFTVAEYRRYLELVEQSPDQSKKAKTKLRSFVRMNHGPTSDGASVRADSGGPVPLEYPDNPVAQAAFEAVYRTRLHMLRHS